MANLARRAAFEADGIVTVPGAVASTDAAAMGDCVRAMLAGGLRLVELLGALRPGPGSDPLLWEVGRASAFAPLDAALQRAVDDVFGQGAWAPVEGQGGLAAPNLPIADRAWNVPHTSWHVDEPTAADQASAWGLLGFAFLDDVEPGGGATVAIAGSQRRLRALAIELGKAVLTTEDAVAALARREPWFADLFAPGDPDDRRRRFMREGCLSGGVPLRLVELVGRAGDITLMDPRCLHTVSANVGRHARLTMRLTCARGADPRR